MLFEPERHQALSSDRWDEQLARAVINRIAADTVRDFSATTLWPTHPDDSKSRATFYNLYMGAAGVIWALDYLKRSGATDTVPDYGAIVVDLIAPNRARMAPAIALGVGGLLSGDTGILLAAARLNGIPTAVEQIGEAVDGNADNPCREFMYGAPGTAVASLTMWRETCDAIWAERFRRDICRLWSQLRPCVDTDCLIWEQDLLGQLASHLGAVHGFAGNLLPAIQGWSLLSTQEREDWSACIERTLRATAIRQGKLVNWPQSQGRHRPGRTAVLVQHCHGAPGIVNALAYFTESRIDDLLIAAGELTWHAGPLVKGSGLCHGTAGNGFAFLKLFRRTRDAIWLDRARRFAMHACSQSNAARQQHHQSRYSLWTGDLGLAIYLWHCINLDDRFPAQDFF
jgi:Lanthionine synthetase C-like protein